ncbi:MAG TPA: choice-of-anchor D domain-containing protein [Myxococcota bacterium]|nr:choice-of-anchor D domain-containing protein [Myxococcota bacterium]
MRPTCLLLLSLAACQEITIKTVPPEIPEPEDSDTPEPPATAPDIQVEPTELNFGAFPANCAAEPQKVTITNIGDAELEVSEITLNGPESAVFDLRVAPRTLAPGESFKAQVGFTPTGWEVYNQARVQVLSNDPDEPTVNVNLIGEGAEDAIWEQHWTQLQAASVDVLFVVDNSGSMSDNLRELANSFRVFIQQFDNLGLNYHIAVTTTDMDRADAGTFVGPVITARSADPVGEFRTQTALGAEGSGDERGRDAAHAALTAPLVNAANSGFLRTDANLAIVVVSDEDDSSVNITVPAFNNWLNNLKGNPDLTSFSGMVGPDNGGGFGLGFACSVLGGGDATFAPRYHDVIDATKGVWGDICQYQYQPFLTFLAYVAAGLIVEYPLDRVPSAVGGIQVLVDGVSVPYGAVDGWTYDANQNRVVLNGDSIPDPGAVIVIEYPYATECD